MDKIETVWLLPVEASDECAYHDVAPQPKVYVSFHTVSDDRCVFDQDSEHNQQ